MKGHPATDLTPSSPIRSHVTHILSLYRGPGLLIINGKPRSLCDETHSRHERDLRTARSAETAAPG